MNILIEENPQENAKWLYNQILKICNDYFQEITIDNIKYIANRCCEYGIRNKKTTKDFEKAFNELLVNFTTYRKITTSSILTALHKVTQ
jgi:hypothetical protein